MIGIKLFNPNPLGLVTVIATLFVAAVVNGEPGVVFDTENQNQISLECEDSRSSPWSISTDSKLSPKKEIFTLPRETKGCFVSRVPVTLNASEKFIVKFRSENPQDENGQIIIRLVPKEGQCPDEECVWKVPRNAQLKEGEWDSQEYTFPLKTPNQYTIHLSAEKLKGKFLLDSLAIPNAKATLLGEGHFNGIQEHQLSFGNGTSGAVGLHDLGKNILFTTASVLTLNNILN